MLIFLVLFCAIIFIINQKTKNRAFLTLDNILRLDENSKNMSSHSSITQSIYSTT